MTIEVVRKHSSATVPMEPPETIKLFIQKFSLHHTQKRILQGRLAKYRVPRCNQVLNILSNCETDRRIAVGGAFRHPFSSKQPGLPKGKWIYVTSSAVDLSEGYEESRPHKESSLAVLLR